MAARRAAGDQRLPRSLSDLLQHVQEQARGAGSEKLAARLVRLLHCVSPRITDADPPQVLDIDLNVLRPLCAEGIPDEAPALRAALWKLLLGYLPCDAFSWDAALTSARETHAGFLRELLAELPVEEASARVDADEEHHQIRSGSAQTDEEENRVLPLAQVYDQIRKDVFRTKPGIDFFCGSLGRRDEGEQRITAPASSWTADISSRDPDSIDVVKPSGHYDIMARILLLFAKLNPGVQYVQGMNELCAPLYFLFAQDPLHFEHAEADTFFCFNLLMSDMRDAFVRNLDHTEDGMMGRIEKFSELLREKDEEVWQHLDTLGVSPLYYTVRWLTLMLAQELELAEVLHLWDSLLSDLAQPHPLLRYLCVARVMNVREELLAGDFTVCMGILQHYPQVAVDDILSAALKLRAEDRARVGFSCEDLEAAGGYPDAAVSVAISNRQSSLTSLWWPWQ